jgi:hypothetical protein
VSRRSLRPFQKKGAASTLETLVYTYKAVRHGSKVIRKSGSQRNILAKGRAIAQAVSRWLPTAVVRGSRPGRHVGFCGGQSGSGAGFLRVLRFPLPNSFHQLLQKIIFIIIIIIINKSSGICTIGQMGKRLWPQYKGLIDT